MASTEAVRTRIANLKAHIGAENPELAAMVGSYEDMDGVLRRLRLLRDDETLAARISWWPVVSVLGMFSAGKSTAINDLVGERVQRTSRQAQDDKFTVLCYGPERADLPGTALSVDSRFPFYGMADEIEKVAPGEGRMVDSFLALRTVPSETLRGMILVDSPGFDSDDYRSARLRLADHIMDLSDLVLVYCDANRPEPGAMRDTLALLVAKSQRRADADKFLYVLNQIDVVAKDDNVEEVVAAWQRAMATTGLTTGRFFTVYSDSARVEIADLAVAARLKAMRDRDMAEIHARIAGLRAKRGYRVASGIEAVAKDVTEAAIPQLAAAIGRWRFRTNMLTVAALGAGMAALVGGFGLIGDPTLPFQFALQVPEIAAVAALGGALAVHWKLGSMLAVREAARLPEKLGDFELRLREAFLRATRIPAILRRAPVGWGAGAAKAMAKVREAVAGRVRSLNDRFADPSSSAGAAATTAAPSAAAE